MPKALTDTRAERVVHLPLLTVAAALREWIGSGLGIPSRKSGAGTRRSGPAQTVDEIQVSVAVANEQNVLGRHHGTGGSRR